MDRLKPPQIFSAASSKNALITQQVDNPNCSVDAALGFAALLLGSYSKADCADPEVFASMVVSVFSRYPEDVVAKVVDPISGLPGKLKWFPKLPEIREACEDASLAAKRIVEQKERVKAQFAERDRMEAMAPAERRKEFVKREMEIINAAYVAASDRPPPPVDIRKMAESPEKDALRRKLGEEHKRLRAEIAANPPQASTRLLVMLGIDPLGRGMGNGAGRPVDHFDDSLP